MKKRSVRICPWILTIKVKSEESKGKKARNPIRHRSAHSCTHSIIEALTATLTASSKHS
ncbi:hypothetical protein [Paenibacillus urinalis]|uniref:Uncharacterized protein n=1 Tax=Paenibacillus urinalis TaxID=521520 RepID=A0AAX3N712_9BACL|nr:hypothetical protein [Paenibacillus urinalis]WDH84784.1 hypothetical protein PUW23_11450 [Paenibacillus urinalis]